MVRSRPAVPAPGPPGRPAVALAVVVVVAVIALVAVALIALVAAGPASGPGAGSPIRAEQRLPADVRAEVDATWARFAAAFPARVDCLDQVDLRLVDRVDGGDARYVVPERRIEIEIPTSPRRFRESLVHELAHHLEHTCAEFPALRDRFAALPGVPDGPWDQAERWNLVPAELWAETVVAVVNGERVRNPADLPLPDGAEDLVRAWGQGPGVGSWPAAGGG